MATFEAGLRVFLQDIPRDSVNYPKIGVLGMAGPIVNNTCDITNCRHWTKAAKGPVNGYALQAEFQIQTVLLINDFEANG